MVKQKWTSETGLTVDKMRRRRWSDSGATIPLERSLVPPAKVRHCRLTLSSSI